MRLRVRPTYSAEETIGWCPTAIREMLRRDLYVGRVIWNRSRFTKVPGTNKRVGEEGWCAFDCNWTVLRFHVNRDWSRIYTLGRCRANRSQVIEPRRGSCRNCLQELIGRRTWLEVRKVSVTQHTDDLISTPMT